MSLKPFREYPGWEGTGLPTRGTCDLSNPRQRFLWIFTALPGVVGAPLPLPTEYWEHVSYHMVECGLRLGGNQIKKYQPPQGSLLNRWTAAGKWVPLDEPDPPGKTLADVVDNMDHADQIALKEIVLDKMGLRETHPGAPDGHLQVTDLAARLKINPDRLVVVLTDFGLNLTTDSYVPIATAERLITHLGL
ncbi:DUF2744 domain-containing protein [Rhodococcus jostii]|uniref:phage gene 29 protein family protein n=2 Tax=Rhodococcus jostii TaxID=132919 RepID=UPI0036383193